MVLSVSRINVSHGAEASGTGFWGTGAAAQSGAASTIEVIAANSPLECNLTP